MLDFLTEAATGGLFSGVVGMIGGYLNKRQELKTVMLQNEHSLKMVEARSQAEITTGGLQVQQLEVAAFSKSQTVISNVSEIIKSCIRPIILLLLGYMCYQNQAAIAMLVENNAAFTPQELVELHKLVIISVFSLFSMGVGWYFSQRTTKITDKLLNT